MNTSAPEVLTHGEPEGRRFFARSAFRSIQFSIVSGLLVLTIVTDLFIMTKYWNRLPRGLPFLLALFGCGGVIAPWWRSFSWHGRLHELYLVGKPQEDKSDHILDVALNAAASAILEGLFFTFTSILVLLIVIGYFLAGGSPLTR
jgi:hypothetical protein